MVRRNLGFAFSEMWNLGGFKPETDMIIFTFSRGHSAGVGVGGTIAGIESRS